LFHLVGLLSSFFADDVYQLLSQHLPGITMPIFRRTKTVSLQLVYCAVTSGNVDISLTSFFVGQCVYANVVCKWVCRSVGLVVSASYVFSGLVYLERVF